MPKASTTVTKTSSLLETQPHSTEAERTVLGALLIDPEAIYQIDDKLSADDFYDPTCRRIYDTIKRLSENGEPVDLVTVIRFKISSSLQSVP